MSIRSNGRSGGFHRRKPHALAFKPFDLEVEIFLATCEAVNTPRSLACFILISAGEGKQYLELTEPDKLSPNFADDYLVTEMLSKHPGLPGFTDADRKATALDKWIATELQCKRTNDLLSTPGWFESLEPQTSRVILQARRYIANLLGPLTSLDLKYAEHCFRYGPGASSSCKGRDVLPSRKMTSVLDVGPRLYPYWRSLIPYIGREALVHEVNLVGYNSMTFVPKLSLIHI